MIKTLLKKIEMNKIVLNAIVFLLFFVLSLGACEMALRSLGYKPWPNKVLQPEPQGLYVYDPVIGWRCKEGKYTFSYLPHPGNEKTITILPDGSRATSNGENISSKTNSVDIAVIGCSYVMGWGLSDEETLAWKMQKKLPAFKIKNFGVPAYGAYQSLLLLEDLFLHSKPKIVIYGYLPFHSRRNVASYDWMFVTAPGHLHIPYVQMDNKGNLIRKSADKYPNWPLREQLATITLAEKAYMHLKTKKRTEYEKEITAKLILEMKELSEKNGANFVVALLQPLYPDYNFYMDFFKKNKIEVIRSGVLITEDQQIKGDINGHPNGEVNDMWAEYITPKIKIIAYSLNNGSSDR